MKRILMITLTLAMLLAFTVPAYASEGTDIPPETGQETAVSPPEETETPEAPEETPEIPEETEQPEESETPESPEAPETPDPLETPEAPEDPAAPENPEAPEGPAIPEDPEMPEEPENEASEAPEETGEPIPLEDLIQVVVPSAGQMVVNPYGMKVDLDGVETTEQIVHGPQALENLSGFPVTVNVTATGSLPADSAAYFASEPPLPDAWDKEIFLYAEFQSDPDWWAGTYGGWSNQVPVSDRGEAREGVLTLDAFGVGYFRLFGAMTRSPDDMWTSDDAISVTLAFTFVPAAEAYGQQPVQDPDSEPDAEPVPDAEPEPEPEPAGPEPDPEPAPEPVPEPDSEPIPEPVPEPEPEPVPEPEPENPVSPDPSQPDSAEDDSPEPGPAVEPEAQEQGPAGSLPPVNV